MVKYKIPSIELDDDLNGEIADLEKAIEKSKELKVEVIEKFLT